MLAVALLALWIGAVFARDLARARKRVGSGSTVMASASGVLEYGVAGSGSPVLVIHGASGGFDQALDMAAPFASAGFRLIAPSRFGYLQSDMPADATIAMQADAYVELLDRLGVEKAAVVGISAGEWSALAFVIRHPERCAALVLVVPAAFLAPGQKNAGGLAARMMFDHDFFAWAGVKAMGIAPGPLARSMLGVDARVVGSASIDEQARVRLILDHLLPISARSRGIQFDLETAARPVEYAFDRIACPVLTVSAEDDSFGTASRARLIADKVQDGRAVVYASGGHPLVGRQSELVRDVSAFLKSH